uniref:Uncharacterized protein n=1 Tax=Arundo donax TaxID=35708 RepID=A0A0A9HRW2_ARUDO
MYTKMGKSYELPNLMQHIVHLSRVHQFSEVLYTIKAKFHTEL